MTAKGAPALSAATAKRPASMSMAPMRMEPPSSPILATAASVSSSTNFLRGVRDRHVEAISTPLHTGRTTIVVETTLVDADGKRVAKVTQTQAVLRAS